MAIEASNLTGKERYEFERKKANDDYLSDSIYRIDYESYLKRKQAIEYKLADLLSTVEEKRDNLEAANAKKNRINSCGKYSYRERISGSTKAQIWIHTFLTASVLLGFICPTSTVYWISHISLIVIVIVSVISYGVLTGKTNKNKILADIDDEINFKLRNLQVYEKELEDAQTEYEMIIKSEPKRENY